MPASVPPKTDFRMSGAGDREGSAQSFTDWLEPMWLRVVTSRDHGQWYATAEDFGVVGAGESEDAALDNLGRVLCAYLHDFYSRDLPLTAALRPSSRLDPTLRTLMGTVRRLARRLVRRGLSNSHNRTVPLRFVLQ